MSLSEKIKKIKVKNFRVFNEEQEFDFNDINILTGQNNCGKSSIQKLLFLLKSSFASNKNNQTFENLVFTNEVIQKIDLFESNLNYHNNSGELVISFEIEDSLWQYVELQLTYAKSEISQNGVIQSIKLLKDNILLVTYEKIKYNDYIEKHKIESIKDLNENFVWNAVIDLTDEKAQNKLHEIFLNAKKRELEQLNVYLIYYNLVNKMELSLDLQKLKKDFEDQGLIFEDERAMFHKDDPSVEFNRSRNFRIGVWDSKTNDCFEMDEDLFQHAKFFYDRDSRVIFPTFLSQAVLNTPDFFSVKLDDPILASIRSLLFNNDIYSLDVFIEKYKDFEFALIWYNLSNNHDEYTADWDNAGYQVDARIKLFCFSNYFSLNQISYSSHFVRNEINSIGEKYGLRISEILVSEEYIKLLSEVSPPLFVMQYNPQFKESLYGKEIDWSRGADDNYKSYHPKNLNEDFDNLSKIFYKHKIANRSIVHKLNDLLAELLKDCSISFENTFIKKYYFLNQEDSKDEMFIDFGMKFLNNRIELTEKLEFCNTWLKEFGVGDSILVKPILIDNKTIGLGYYLEKNGKFYSIGDNGLGVNQVLMLIIRIILQPEGSLLVIEEPESNLHPAFQSKLADLFIATNKDLKIKFIIETHSEYLIRKLQYLVAKKLIPIEDITIFYLYQPKDIPLDKKQVSKLEIRQDGILKEDFGPGFFDESVRLTIDLLKLQSNN